MTQCLITQQSVRYAIRELTSELIPER